MTLAAGTRLGVYEVVFLLGAGGMGEVYRATDTVLKRQVALKVLPPEVANDPERVARFQREAEVLASLNHPNIAHLYGIETSNSTLALVMELVDGETLADRIAKGPIPLDEALPIAKQIAEALEAAHERGIIHRDLKPANIKVRDDGTVKILDFGLAKAMEASPTSSGPAAALTNSPTITSPALMTGIGVLLGTAAYMSPEQARGRPADKRSDIWAFGCVLFETLTGRRAFEGEDVTDTLAAIVRGEPDWTVLPPDTMPVFRYVIQRCLAKDARARWRDVGDVRVALTDFIGLATNNTVSDASRSAVRRERLAWVSAATFALLAAAVAVFIWRVPWRSIPAAPIQFTIQPPPNGVLRGVPGGGTGLAPQVAISPDGRQVAFIAAVDGRLSLWVRSLASLELHQLPGTDDATFPFWSPDSRSIAFFASGALKRIGLDGGTPVTLCDIGGSGRGGTWNTDNVIVFAPPANALQRVSAAGGMPSAVTALDTGKGDLGHRWPQFLPDGRHFFYTAVSGPLGSALKPTEVRIGLLDSGETTPLFLAESAVSYSQGHLFFWRDGSLLAQRFDPRERRVSGDPFPIAEQVAQEGLRYVSASVAPTGALVYATGATRSISRLTWRDRSGKVLGTVGEPDAYDDIALSPDGHRVAVTMFPRSGSGSAAFQSSLWVINLERPSTTRLTYGGVDLSPVWSPDGETIVFGASRPVAGIYRVSPARANRDELILKDTTVPRPTGWSADGRFVALAITTPRNGLDISILRLGEPPQVTTAIQERASQDHAVFSPDGHWLAYSSAEVGAEQIFVQPFPTTGEKFQISRNGGVRPIWRADGTALFFIGLDGTMYSAPITLGSRFEAGTPQMLFSSGIALGNNLGRHEYDVSQDGQRFLINTPESGVNTSTLTFVTDWHVLASR